MKTYRIIGLDRDSGEPSIVDIQAVDENAARNAGYNRNILIERVEPIRDPSKPAMTRRDEIKKRNAEKISAKQALDEMGGFRKSGNRIAEIAMGVFIGMLMFSCVGPFIIMFLLGLLGGLN